MLVVSKNNMAQQSVPQKIEGILPEAIIILDLNGTVTKTDRQTLHMFGFESEQEVVGMGVADFVIDEDKNRVKEGFQSILLNGFISQFHCSVRRKDGSVFPISANGSLFVDSQGNPKEVVVVVHPSVSNPSQPDPSVQLDQEKTQFLSLVSHQMRGPLTAINWHAEMLLQQQAAGLTDIQKKYIQELYNASKQTVHLTNALLTVSELELGNMPFKPEKLSLQKIAKRVLNDYQHMIAEKKINFKEVYSDELPEVETDLFLLKSIFHVLISNAVNYTPAEGTITMSIAIDPQQPKTFVVTVTDTGYGIPSSEQEKIFTKMFRGSNAKAKVMGGTGLGLYMATLILKLIGGKVAFTSEENKGSTFIVSLPFTPQHNEKSPKST